MDGNCFTFRRVWSGREAVCRSPWWSAKLKTLLNVNPTNFARCTIDGNNSSRFFLYPVGGDFFVTYKIYFIPVSKIESIIHSKMTLSWMTTLCAREFSLHVQKRSNSHWQFRVNMKNVQTLSYHKCTSIICSKTIILQHNYCYLTSAHTF